MPSLTDREERHIVIDHRDGEYICFPDVIRAADGRLVVAYNESDRHIEPTRRVMLVTTSDDNGKTWSKPVRMDSPTSHCPRLTRFADGTLMIADPSHIFFTSRDNGLTWTTLHSAGTTHDMLDAVIDLGDALLTTGHRHVDEPLAAIRQQPTEQMVYRSSDRGVTWEPLSTLARYRNLVLCEASMVRLYDGRILALLRENSFVYEPMYVRISDDEGKSWSDPLPTPLIGHRPTIGLAPDGRLLVTYRNVGPDFGTCAWMGTEQELTGDFKVHGRAPNPTNPALTPEGLHVRNDEGAESVVRYALRPMTDPRTATASFEAEVRVDEAGPNGCAIRLGVWWKLYPDSIVPDIEDATPISVEPGRFHTLRLEYAAGEVTLFVDGEKRSTVTVDDDSAETRPIIIGAPYPFENNSVDCMWRRLSLHIEEPAFTRTYDWSWMPGDGLPDQWTKDNILELQNARHTAAPDFGYSGWTTLEDGTFFCTYHHADGEADDYDPLNTSHIQGTWFSTDDFK